MWGAALRSVSFSADDVADRFDKTPFFAGTSGGTANAQTLTPSPIPTAYYEGMEVHFVCGVTNTTAATMNIGGLGVLNVLDANGRTLQGGEMLAGSLYSLRYYAGNLLLGNGSEAKALIRSITSSSYNNSSAETTIHSGTIVANNLSMGRFLRLTGFVYIVNSSGGSQSYTIRVKLGGVTLTTDVVSTTTSQVVFVEVWLWCTSTTNVLAMSRTNMHNTAPQNSFHGGAAITTTNNNTLLVTTQISAAAGTLGVNYYGFVVEQI